MTDPYKVLGVSPTASDDEIKQAYRELVRKYHPDKYANTDLAEMATEKMKEVNAAYEEVQRLRKAGGSSHSTGSTGGYGYTDPSGAQSPTFAAIRAYINQGNLDQAHRQLMAIPESDRAAEWNFLMGCVLLRRGATMDAQQYLDLACAQNPYNSEYRMVRDRLRAQTNAYTGGYRTAPSYHTSGCTDCDICSSLLCADCLCECMGGDLISCC
jgi:hypothetical protein